MSPDDAVILQVRNRFTADPLRLSYVWPVLDADHVVMLRPKPHDFGLQGRRHYLVRLNIYRRDGETFADDFPVPPYGTPTESWSSSRQSRRRLLER
jgi:AraC family transcriptional regulator